MSLPAPVMAATAGEPGAGLSAEEEAKEKRRKRLEAWKAQQQPPPPAPPAPSASLPAAPAAAPTAFGVDADAEDRELAAKQAERRRKLAAMAAEMQTDKMREQAGLPSGGGSTAGGSAGGPSGGGAAAEEEDPLDAFMRENVFGQAEKERERAAAHEVAWQAQYGDKDVAVSDVIEVEKNMNAHCYVCKQWGHTKKDCPHKRCLHCGKEGHIKEDCPKLNEKIEGQIEADKQRKRAKQYAAKKAKKREQWSAELRAKTGVDGFQVLYEILGLPPRKLASREEIKRAYHRQSLRYHPDKVSEEEAEEAAEKFVAVKAAYELLLEGMETGGAGLGGAVFSGGDLEYTGGPSAEPFAGPASEGGADFGGEEGGGEARGGEASGGEASGVEWLRDDELLVLLGQEHVRDAVERIAAQPAVLAEFEKDAVVMGVLYSLHAQAA